MRLSFAVEIQGLLLGALRIRKSDPLGIANSPDSFEERHGRRCDGGWRDDAPAALNADGWRRPHCRKYVEIISKAADRIDWPGDTF